MLTAEYSASSPFASTHLPNEDTFAHRQDGKRATPLVPLVLTLRREVGGGYGRHDGKKGWDYYHHRRSHVKDSDAVSASRESACHLSHRHSPNPLVVALEISDQFTEVALGNAQTTRADAVKS